MNNKVIVTVVSVFAILAFLFLAYKLTNVATPVNYPQVNILTKTDHLTWSPAKKNVLIEYGDLQCPACQNYYFLIKSNIENTDIPKKVTFVFRHYPLTNVHEHAEEAAEAAEAAGNQNKFFEYVDLLYKNQQNWEKSTNTGEY